MCGDFEDDQAGEELAYGAFLHAAHAAIHDAVDHRGGSRNLSGAPLSDHDLHQYMDGLFADLLRACITDGGRAAEADRYRLLSVQAVVVARLAGFLAGRLDLGQDPLRSTIEALMAGYSAAEPEIHHHHHD